MRLAVHAVADATIFSIDASGTIEINTTSTTRLNVTPGFLLRLSGTVSILKVLNFEANLLVEVRDPASTAGGWSWHLHADARVDFFGLATLSGSIDLYDNGDFRVDISGGMTLGSSDYGLVGNFHFLIYSEHYEWTTADVAAHGGQVGTYYRFGVSGGASVKVRAFGITLAGVGLDFSVTADSRLAGADGRVKIALHVHVEVEFLFFTIEGDVDITLGYIQLPPPVWMASDGTSQSVIIGSTATTVYRNWDSVSTTPRTLYLNVGNRAVSRNIGVDDMNESMIIEQVGGTATDATIKVSAYGRSNTYVHVSQINATVLDGNDFGGGNDNVVIKPGVLVPVIIDGGAGNDAISYEGTSTCDPTVTNSCTETILSGGAGNDFLSAIGHAILNGDGDDDTLMHFGANGAILNGGADKDKLYGSSTGDQLNGQAGDDVLTGPATSYKGGGGRRPDHHRSQRGAPAGDDHRRRGRGRHALPHLRRHQRPGHPLRRRRPGPDQPDNDVLVGWQVKGDSSTAQSQSVLQVEGSTSTWVPAATTLTVRDLSSTPVTGLLVDLGRTKTVNGTRTSSVDEHGNALPFPMEIPDVRYSDDRAADSITVEGAASAADTFQVINRTATDGSTGTQVTTTLGANDYAVDIDHGVRGEGDTLVLDTFGGADDISAKDVTTDTLALVIRSGAGNDTIVGSRFDDRIDSGLGDDIVTGGDGRDTFTDAGGSDTIKEDFDRDFFLSNNTLVIGRVASQNPGTAFTSAIVEDLGGLFEKAILTGGAGANTFLIGDLDGSLGVPGSLRVVDGWSGEVTIDAKEGNDLVVVSTRGYAAGAVGDPVGEQVHVTGGAGTDRLVLEGTDLREDVVVDKTGNLGRITSTEWAPDKRTESVTIDHTGMEDATLRTFGGADRILVKQVDLKHTIETGIGDDEIAVGNNAGFGTATVSGRTVSVVTNSNGTLNQILAELVLRGGTGTDNLWFDDTFDSQPNNGTLTRDKLTGLGMATPGSTYVDFEWLDIDLGSGDDTLTIQSTHGETGQPVRTKRTDITLNGGDDVLNVQTIDGPTTADLGAGANNVRVGSLAPTTNGGTLDGIQAKLTLTALGGNDTLTVDDSGAPAGSPRIGTVTGNRITGLGMTFNASRFLESGNQDLPDLVQVVRVQHAMGGRFRLHIDGLGDTADLDYDATAGDVQEALEALVGAGNVLVTKAGGTWVVSYLGALAGAAGWSRTLTMVAGTLPLEPETGQSVTTSVSAMSTGWISYTGFDQLGLQLGAGDDVLNVDSTPGPATIGTGAGDDVVMIETLDDVTTIDGGTGDDILYLNPVVRPNEPTGLGGDLTLIGGYGSDYFLVGLWGVQTRRVTVQDGFIAAGNPDADTNVLLVNGTLAADTFLFRASHPITGSTRALIALLNSKDSTGFHGAEMVVYDSSINGGGVVNGLAGDDTFAFDDTSTFLTVNGDSGNDRFFVGQLLTDYVAHPNFGIPVGTGFPGNSLFDANFFASTRGWLTNGVSDPVTINGGTGDDLFDIFRNKDSLTLNGEDGDDTFIIRTFVADSELTKVSSGVGRDLIRYVMNAPVAIDGGDGYDTVIFVGTEFADTFVITANGVYGAGRYVSYLNVERLVIDGMEGNDRFYVQSTNANVETRIVGGLGSDRVEIAGHAPAVQADDLLGHSGIVTASIETATGTWKGIPIDGIAADIADADAPEVVITPPTGGLTVNESSGTAPFGVRLSQLPTGNVVVTVQAPAINLLSTSRVRGVELSVDGITWGTTATLTFTTANYMTQQFIRVRAIIDAASEDLRTVVLQTSATGGGYTDTMVTNTLVQVVDDEAAGVVVGGIDQGGLHAVEPYVVSGTVVSSTGSTVTYRIRLNRTPLTDVSITVDPGSQMKVVGSATLKFLAGTTTLEQTVTLEALHDGLVEGPHFGYVNQTITSTGDIWSGQVRAVTGKKNEIAVDKSLFPAGALVTNALRGYLVRIYDGTGEGQYRRIFESYVSGDNLVIATETAWDVLPGTDAHFVVSGYVAPPTVDALGGKVTAVSGDGRTITLSGVTLPTDNGGLVGAIVRITDGSGPGQYRRIASNTATTITTVDAWGAGTIAVGTTVAVLGVHGVEIDRVSVAIADSDTPGVVVLPTDGSTRLVEGSGSSRTGEVTDTYTVRLTRAPGQTLRVWLDPQKTPTAYFPSAIADAIQRNEVQVTLSGPGVHTTVVNGVTRYYVEFTDSNWDTEIVVTVTAVIDGVRDGNDLQAFAPVARLVNVIQGPLFVFGGLDPDPAYNTSLDRYLPIVLPGESSGPPKPPVLPTIRVDETKQVDQLVLHNEDSPADLAGNLTSTRITGLGMAPDTYVAGRLFQGGVTYADLEALEIHLGYGNDTFTVDSTHTGTTLIEADPGEPTAPQQGNDKVYIHSLRGHTVVYGRGGDDEAHVGTVDGAVTLNQIKALLSVDGGTGYDSVFLDDSGETLANWASITPTSVTGLGMQSGTDNVWVLRPGTASVVTLVVAGIGFLQFSVGTPTAQQAAAGILRLTEANLEAALQHLIFPLGMTYTGPKNDPTHVVTEQDWTHTGCGQLGTSDCAPSVWVHQLGDGFLIGFQGELQGSGAPALQAFDLGSGIASIARRRDGVEYAALEVLDIKTGSAYDVVNVRGTGATSHTDLHTGAGDDRIYVSSLANVPLTGQGSRPDYLFGDLSLIGGTLNIDAGTGRQTLMISDEASLVGDTNVVITDDRSKALTRDGRANADNRLTSASELANADIYVIGLAGRAITFSAAPAGTFANGVWIWSGYGADTISVDGTHDRRDQGVRTVTFLNTGLGNDDVTVTLDRLEDDMLVLNTQGAYDQNVRTIDLYGGDDLRPGDQVLGVTIGGVAVAPGRFSGNADLDTVGLFDSGTWTSSGWAAVAVTVLRTLVEVRELTAQRSLTLDNALEVGDLVTVTVNGGVPLAVEKFAWTAGSAEVSFTEDVTGLVAVTVQRRMPYQVTGSNATDPDDDVVRGGLSTLPLIVFGGQGSDTIVTGSGADLVFGDRGRVLYVAGSDGVATYVGNGGPGDVTDGRDLPISSLWTVDPRVGGADGIATGSGNDVVLGGAAGDGVHTGSGDDVVLGDHGSLTFSGGALATLTPDATFLGGNDVVLTDAGDDLVVGGTGSDAIDAGVGRDLVLGDNATLVAKTGASSPRYRVLSGTTLYDGNGNALVTPVAQVGPGTPAWWRYYTLTLIEHTAAIETTNGPGKAVQLYGDDHLAGGAGDDMIFGQLGDDTIQGDGGLSILPLGGSYAFTVTVDAWRTPFAGGGGFLTVLPSFDAASDGEDYIEGGGGADAIFGNLGQDDLIGGSSSFFGLADVAKRPDASDLVFGGSGLHRLRNNLRADGTADVFVGDGNGRDADTIVGDNGEIYRLVAADGTTSLPGFNYDNAYDQQLVVRSVRLLDYTPGGPNVSSASLIDDIRGDDEIHGESGDDTIYLGAGNDIAYGDAGDDDIVGGWGHDWISGGTGQDGVLGDDGRIFTYRNGTAEPLNGVCASATPGACSVPVSTQGRITTPGSIQVADTYVTGQLNKWVDLTPFAVANNIFVPLASASYANDVVFGGLGSDFLHGGYGDDALSGAEALEKSYAPTYAATNGSVVQSDWTRPWNDGSLLGFDAAAGDFVLYDEYDPRRAITLNGDGTLNKTGDRTRQWFLNNSSSEGPLNSGVPSDGDDVLFGDHGNDWIVGGTGRDTLWGGWGNDLLQADDRLETNGFLNDQPDTNYSWEDRAVGGAGLDVLIGNTGGDRLIDWVGEFNSFLVPFAPFGMATVSRQVPPGLMEFLYALSRAQGADPTLGNATDPRNGEPFGEAGIVTQKDGAWQDQTGGPRDPQAGNIGGGKRDVLRGADFNSTTSLDGFFVDSGAWEVNGGALSVGAQSLGQDAAAVFYVDEYLPVYYELAAAVESRKPTAGWKANAYMIFDYFSPTDFKYAGIDISTKKLVMGYRDASGWHVIAQTPKQMNGDQYYQLLLTVNGTTATLVVDGSAVFTYTYAPRYIDGVRYGLNKGMVGMGSENARGVFDNVRVQILPPQVTYDATSNLTTGTQQLDSPISGTWSSSAQGYRGTAATGGAAVVPATLGGVNRLASTSWSEITAKLTTAGFAGIAFDSYGAGDFKFAAIDVPGQRVVLGHLDPRGGWTIDASYAQALVAGTTYTLVIALKGASTSVTLNGMFMVSTGFNAGVVDGRFGLMSRGGDATFTSLRVRTDDGAMVGVPPPQPPPPPVVPSVSVADVSVQEGSSGTTTATVTVTLSQATTTTVSVPWSLVAGTATSGVDFSGASGTLVFSPGQTQMVILVSVLGDLVVEGDEAFQVVLGTVTGATLGRGAATVTIRNDDTAPPPPPTPTVSIGNASVAEGRSGTTSATLTVTLSQASTSTVTVVVGRVGGTATSGSDFAFSTVTLTFAPGVTSRTVTVLVYGDRTAELNETVLLGLSAPVGATLGTATGTLTILDDDSNLVASAVGPGVGGALTAAELNQALAAAKAYWRAEGVSANRFVGVRISLEQMEGTSLAQAMGQVVRLDTDGAGWGWGPGGMDLFSVLVHEIGHVLGFEHTPTGVMAAVLAPGEQFIFPEPAFGGTEQLPVAARAGAAIVEATTEPAPAAAAMAVAAAALPTVAVALPARSDVGAVVLPAIGGVVARDLVLDGSTASSVGAAVVPGIGGVVARDAALRSSTASPGLLALLLVLVLLGIGGVPRRRRSFRAPIL